MTKKILVIKLGALGDFIQTLGPMAAIRKYHSEDHITLLTTHPYAELADRSPYFNAVKLFTRPGITDLKTWYSLWRWLNDSGFDRVYDLQNSKRSDFYFKLLGNNHKPEWVGTAKGASHCNDSPQRVTGTVFEGHIQTLALAGIKDISIDNLTWIKSDVERFGLQDPYILMVPGSSPKVLKKRWPAEYYAAFANHFIKKGVQPVLLGTKTEEDIFKTILEKAPECINLGGQTTLFDIPPLAHGALFSIGNDTGPIHVIGPTGQNCFVLFSDHSRMERYKPLGQKVQGIQEANLENLMPEKVIDFVEKAISCS